MNQLLFLATLFCDIHVIIWFAVIFHGALYRKKNNHADRNLRTANLWHLCRKKNSLQIIFLKPHEHFLVPEEVGLQKLLKKNKNKNPMKYCSRSICLNLVKSRNFFNNLFDFKLLCCALIQFQ